MLKKFLAIIFISFNLGALAQEDAHDPFHGTVIDQVFGDKVAPEQDILKQAKDKAAGKPGVTDFSITSMFKRNQDQFLIKKKDTNDPSWVDLNKTGKEDEFSEAYRKYEKSSDYKIRKELDRKDPERDEFNSKIDAIEERLNNSAIRKEDKKDSSGDLSDSLEKRLAEKKERELEQREERTKKLEEDHEKQKLQEVDESEKELERVFK